MDSTSFYLAGSTPSLVCAGAYLARQGVDIAPQPDGNVTHLLLPVPSFDAELQLVGGEDLGEILVALRDDITILGGRLNHPLLEGYRTVDLLQDDEYLAQNAAITADCAISLLRNRLPVILQGCPILIIGWGRIGKCLGGMLKAAGADVTVAARKDADLAMLRALGFQAQRISELPRSLREYRAVFNTAPAQVISPEESIHFRPDCVKIDLASRQGIWGRDVLHARALPGKLAPESAGVLMAKTALRLLGNREGCV